MPPTLQPDPTRFWAIEAGFSDAALLPLPHAEAARDAHRFESFIAAGNAGSMSYLERRSDQGELLRARVATPFPWARSVVVCFSSYQGTTPLSTAPADPGAAWIARYAISSRIDREGNRRPSDYHKVLKKRLEALESRLRTELTSPNDPVPFEARGFVDTGPVVERSLAVAAGLGWIGKNTCLIHPRLGSFGFLAVLLSSLPVQNANAPAAQFDRCGTCRRCIEACPTDALIAPYQMDATRCISYLTIEHKGPIAPELMPGIGRQVFGCDICQDVCPWNHKSLRTGPIATDPDLQPRPELINPALEALAALDEPAFEREFNGSPIRRAGFNGLRRNIAIAIGNAGLKKLTPVLAAWSVDPHPALSSAAKWALEKLNSQASMLRS